MGALGDLTVGDESAATKLDLSTTPDLLEEKRRTMRKTGTEGGKERKTNGAVAAHLSKNAFMRDLRRPFGELKTLRDLVHRLGQVGLGDSGGRGDEEKLNDEGTAASSRRLVRLRSEGNENPRLLQVAVGGFGGESNTSGGELTVGRDVVVERIGSGRWGGSEDLGRSDCALLRGGEDTEAAARFRGRGGRR